MSRLEDLYSKMIDEAPIYFNESQKKYFLELAKIYAKEVAKASLEKASERACIEPKGMMTRVDKESITSESNIVLL